jgi:hypothetical protein
MTSTQQAARAAAQLRQAAQDVARVAARRSAQAEGSIAELPMQRGYELTEDLEAEGREARSITPGTRAQVRHSPGDRLHNKVQARETP